MKPLRGTVPVLSVLVACHDGSAFAGRLDDERPVETIEWYESSPPAIAWHRPRTWLRSSWLKRYLLPSAEPRLPPLTWDNFAGTIDSLETCFVFITSTHEDRTRAPIMNAFNSLLRQRYSTIRNKHGGEEANQDETIPMIRIELFDWVPRAEEFRHWCDQTGFSPNPYVGDTRSAVLLVRRGRIEAAVKDIFRECYDYSLEDIEDPDIKARAALFGSDGAKAVCLHRLLSPDGAQDSNGDDGEFYTETGDGHGLTLRKRRRVDPIDPIEWYNPPTLAVWNWNRPSAWLRAWIGGAVATTTATTPATPTLPSLTWDNFTSTLGALEICLIHVRAPWSIYDKSMSVPLLEAFNDLLHYQPASKGGKNPSDKPLYTVPMMRITLSGWWPNAKEFRRWWEGQGFMPEVGGKYRSIVLLVRSGQVEAMIFNIYSECVNYAFAGDEDPRLVEAAAAIGKHGPGAVCLYRLFGLDRDRDRDGPNEFYSERLVDELCPLRFRARTDANEKEL